MSREHFGRHGSLHYVSKRASKHVSTRTGKAKAINLERVRQQASAFAKAAGLSDVDIEDRIRKALAEPDMLDDRTRMLGALALLEEEMSDGRGDNRK